ncbi:hypothetical protein JQ609_05250 [Bradyrhizobium sp. AUGA SZCCT0169]|uniref:hypothetical protein n=1 Tax=Bradyrhizobium sp. AUGA SZCCT0169 TaxID=2807663 RepID=UPI001BACF18E|nr:hypothetical protein [Bradyrhizobium sp. AUGA SZCCT0169]MBR1246336.1 hypothetical protein [Bradyrhizobium sp. AUGA SZCCT0169]
MPIVEIPIEIATSPKRYPPVGHCIYCGVYSKKLSKEHIIPFGLAQDSLILPKSSCEACATITSKQEATILRSMWWTLRTRLGAPSRSSAPENFNLHKGIVDEFNLPWITKARHTETVKVENEQFPFVVVMPKFPQPPSVFVGREPNDDDKVEAWIRYSEEEAKKHLSGDKSAIGLAPVEPATFARFLSKIAHSYAVAELGHGAFQPLLAKFIRNRPLLICKWLGGQAIDPPATESLHDIQWEIQTIDATHYVVVNIRLFSFFGSPLYCVVVGSFNTPLSSLPYLKQPLYSIEVKRRLPFEAP